MRVHGQSGLVTVKVKGLKVRCGIEESRKQGSVGDDEPFGVG